MIWVIKERWCTWSANALTWHNVGLAYYYNPVTYKESIKQIHSVVTYKARSTNVLYEDV
jgi:hypothetical protein